MKSCRILLCYISVILISFLSVNCNTDKVEPNNPDQSLLHLNNIDNLNELIATIEQTADSELQLKMANELWDSLVAQKRIPWISNDTIIFLYKGSGSSVHFVGDMTGWGIKEDYLATKIGNSTIWYLLKTFPTDARIDYKVVTNGSNWTMDPNNPKQQLSGFGYNSAFSMPEYDSSVYLVENLNIAKGTLSEAQLISSSNLGHNVRYWVYTPTGYTNLSNLSTIYVADGQEYKQKGMGSMVTVLDNLIAANLINPVIAVFVDPVNPATSQNQRAELFLNNVNYADFFAQELVPFIDANYKTNPDALSRAILGTSYGGNNATWFGYQIPETFKLIASQSPAFQSNVLTLYSNSATLGMSKFFITTGVINDTELYADQLEQILISKGVPYKYMKVNEGHSWGNWSALLDEMLVYFFSNGK